MNQEDIIKSKLMEIPDLMNLLCSSYSIIRNMEITIRFSNDKDMHRFKFYNIDYTRIILKNYEEIRLIKSYIVHDAGMCCFIDALKITWFDESPHFEYYDSNRNKEKYWNMLSEEMNWKKFGDGLKMVLVDLV